MKRTAKVRGSRWLEPYLLLAPALLIVIGLMGYPLIDSIRISFLKYNLMKPKNIRFNGLDNYIKLFNDPEIGKVLLNSLQWVVVVVAFQFLLGMMLALLLNSSRFRGRGVYQSVAFLPWAVSGFIIGLTFKWIFAEHNGVINQLLLNLHLVGQPIAWLGEKTLSMIGPMAGMIWYGVPFFGIMILAALKSIPAEMYESAKLDGANAIGQFAHLTIPFIKPTLIMTLLLRVIWVFNSPDIIYIMTEGGPANSSSTLSLYVFDQAFYSMDFGYGSAVGILMMVLLILYAMLFLKFTRYEEAGDF